MAATLVFRLRGNEDGWEQVETRAGAFLDLEI